MKLHKRPSDVNQQIAKSVRVQLPRDGSRDGTNTWSSGEVPPGFVSVWDFSGRGSKQSSTVPPRKD